MTAAWTSDELERIGAAEELEITPLAADGAPRSRARSGWFHVRAGGVERDVELLEASDAGHDAVDAAYHDKYDRYPSYVEPMVRPEAQATTLKLVPVDTSAG